MKFFFYTSCLLALITAGNTALAHGPGGSASGDTSGSPAIKFNIAPNHREPATFQRPPNMKLSVDGETIRLSLTEQDGTPIDTKFADAKTYVTAGGRLSTVNLWPAGDNILSGKGDFIAEPGMRVDVKLHMPGRETIRKDFYPLK